jgi:hypothetical protein
MKARLITAEGAIRDIDIYQPYPDTLRMAKAGVAILDPKDMMVSEKQQFPEIVFRKAHVGKDLIIYREDSATS